MANQTEAVEMETFRGFCEFFVEFGRYATAKELARVLGISAATAVQHFKKLVASGHLLVSQDDQDKGEVLPRGCLIPEPRTELRLLDERAMQIREELKKAG